MYVEKVERKGRTKGELDEVLHWLASYESKGLNAQIARVRTSPHSSPRRRS